MACPRSGISFRASSLRGVAGRMCSRAARWVLLGTIAIVVASKFMSGHRTGMALPPVLFWMVVAAEISAGLLMLTRFYGQAAFFMMVMSFAGLVVDVVLRERSCGCFGDLLGKKEGMIAKSVIVWLGAVVSLRGRRIRRVDDVSLPL